MAMTPRRTASATPIYEPNSIYYVKLNRAVKVGAATIRPLGVHQMTGAVLNEILANEGADAVAAAESR